MTRLSLNTRLLFSASFILVAFLSVSAFSLDNAFQNSANKAQYKQLRNTIYSLLAAADFSESGHIVMPVVSVIPELTLANSGLYAQIVQRDQIIWRSESLLGQNIPFPQTTNGATETFSFFSNQQGTEFINLAYKIVWENDKGQQFNFVFNVSEDLSSHEKEKAGFRKSLWSWLGGTGLLLLLVQVLVLRWSLKPLNKAANDLNAIKDGRQDRLSGDYPKELTELTNNINHLLDQEQSRRSRYKNALADLAHSIKTPLAIIKNEMQVKDSSGTSSSTEQLDRIVGLVDYQLQRAAMEGKATLQAPIDLDEIIHKILTSLDKVYQRKQVQIHYTSDKGIVMRSDEGDIYELIGNLLDNAYKYCQQKVEITVEKVGQDIQIKVDDDGTGIPENERKSILTRGRRIDSMAEGQGIGLAIVQDIVSAYQGKLTVTQSHLGGACFTITLAQH